MAQDRFKTAYENLKLKDARTAKAVIMHQCKWSPQLWSMKMTGERLLSPFSEKKVNEVSVVESTFKALGVDAWSGEPVT